VAINALHATPTIIGRDLLGESHNNAGFRIIGGDRSFFAAAPTDASRPWLFQAAVDLLKNILFCGNR
jgi:hypothetical protein